MDVLWPFCITGVQQCQVLTKTNKNEVCVLFFLLFFSLALSFPPLQSDLSSFEGCSWKLFWPGQCLRGRVGLSVEGERNIAEASSQDNNVWSSCATLGHSRLSSESGRPEMFPGGRRLSDQRRCRMLFLRNGRSSPPDNRYLCWWQNGPVMKEQHLSSHLRGGGGCKGADGELVIKILTGKEGGLSM